MVALRSTASASICAFRTSRYRWVKKLLAAPTTAATTAEETTAVVTSAAGILGFSRIGACQRGNNSILALWLRSRRNDHDVGSVQVLWARLPTGCVLPGPTAMRPNYPATGIRIC